MNVTKKANESNDESNQKFSLKSSSENFNSDSNLKLRIDFIFNPDYQSYKTFFA